MYKDNLKKWILKIYEDNFFDDFKVNFGILGNYQNQTINIANRDPNLVTQIVEKILNLYKFEFEYFFDKFIEYNREEGNLHIELFVPEVMNLPKIFTEKIQRNKKTETEISRKEKNEIYDETIYLLSIIIPSSIFRTLKSNIIKSVSLNLLTNRRSEITGNQENKLFLSIFLYPEQVQNIDFQFISPKKTFKYLKGVSASKLSESVPIEPIVKFEKNDKRFTRTAKDIDSEFENINLAEMNWLEFEDLIRFIFEKEFAETNAEVKVTRASKDGGVDAIVFNPDPIKGGKIIIQAKRYTNTVEVSAVRDLYGTLLNEGAQKGILVTTSDYGKDSYEFASNKPLTLINGSNLLFLLNKHGLKYRNDIAEAKRNLSNL
jgi:restriction system protein